MAETIVSDILGETDVWIFSKNKCSLDKYNWCILTQITVNFWQRLLENSSTSHSSLLADIIEKLWQNTLWSSTKEFWQWNFGIGRFIVYILAHINADFKKLLWTSDKGYCTSVYSLYRSLWNFCNTVEVDMSSI